MMLPIDEPNLRGGLRTVDVVAQSPSVFDAAPSAALLFGLMLAAAILGGYVAHLLRVPRVVGYLLAGGVLKVTLYWLLGGSGNENAMESLEGSAKPLKAITDLGLGVILFSIGSVFEVRHLRSLGPRLLKLSLGESLLTFLLVFGGTAAIGFAVVGEAAAATILAFSMLLGTAAIATAPAATLFVVREYGAKGPATDTILGLTGLNNIICIVLFHVGFSVLAATGALGPVDLTSSGIWFDLVTTTVGSVVLGVALGFVLSLLHAKLRHADTMLILVAMLIVAGASESWLLNNHSVSFNFLLAMICMGATFANVAIDPSSLDTKLQEMSRPILVGFFVIAGYKLHLGDLGDLQLLGAAYIICRLLGKVCGVYLGLRWSKASEPLPPMLGLALLCQAAVVIGLADFVGEYWQSDWAGRFTTVVLGSVVIFEICGPLLTKEVVKRAGEVKAVTLLRRTKTAPTGGVPIVALSFHALIRTVGLNRTLRGKDASLLQVRHIMRSNIKCLPAGADFDEVLHFVEQSRFNHFPVVDEEQNLVGVIHFKDIQGIMYDPQLVGLLTAADISDENTKPVPADMSLKELLSVFQRGNVGSLPVVDTAGSRRVVGIIEQRDVLRAAHQSREGS